VTVTDTESEDAGREVPVRHHGAWTEADYRGLGGGVIGKGPLGDGRVELIDGALVIGPAPTADDERAIAAARAALVESLPEGLCVVGPVGLRMGPDCLLVPDLVVMREPAEPESETPPDPEAVVNTPPEAVIDAGEVLMVAEIVGPDDGAVDRVFKPLVYARARLPYLLLVDRHAPFASASMVINGRYHEYARAVGPDELELEEPYRLRLPLPEK
jgi:Putative restriction endonuclease